MKHMVKSFHKADEKHQTGLDSKKIFKVFEEILASEKKDLGDFITIEKIVKSLQNKPCGQVKKILSKTVHNHVQHKKKITVKSVAFGIKKYIFVAKKVIKTAPTHTLNSSQDFINVNHIATLEPSVSKYQKLIAADNANLARLQNSLTK